MRCFPEAINSRIGGRVNNKMNIFGHIFSGSGQKAYSHFVGYFSEFDLKLANIFRGCFLGHLTPNHKRIFNLVYFDFFLI